ncbi:MAG: hypothetical protein ACOZQL_27865 [Myxococcota bacterium]
MLRASQALLAAISVLCLLPGCPAPAPQPDAATEVPDAGEPDAGVDAGRATRDAGQPDAGFTAAPVEAWCQLRALAECDRDRRCGRLGDGGWAGCVLLKTYPGTCDQTALTRGVDERRVQYLEGEGVKCLNGYGAGSCEDTPVHCASAFTGLAPPDAGCLSTLDCDAFGFCDLYDGRCPHRCRAWTPLGEPCDGFFRRCDPSSAVCDDSDAGVALCQPKRSAGERCSRWDGCGDTMACTNGACVTRVVGPGERCAVEGGYPLCTEEYFCRQEPPVNGVRPPGVCERRAGLGDTCTGPGTCLPSLRCSTLITTGRCLPKGALREACVSWDDCQDGLYCDSKLQRCEALPGPDGGCSSEVTSYRCAPGNTCTFSTERCQAWQPEGQACSFSGECLTNNCEFGALPDGGFGGRCVAACSQKADGGL